MPAGRARPESNVPQGQLVQGLRLFDATTIIMGSMIGSGIFIVPANMARDLESPGLLLAAWGLTAVMTVIGALTYGELAAAMPRAGGQYVFARAAEASARTHTPVFSLVIQAAWASLLALSGTYSELLEYVIFAQLLFYVLTVAGLVMLRRKRPDLERPYKAFGYPVLPVLFMSLAAFVMMDLLWVKPKFTWPGLIIALTGVPVYFFWKGKGVGQRN